ncbi:MAG: RNA polymerase sigma factor [Candidatus Colwellbacteria bacterium]|nr:RNA polymerase sigma factor [Candidatus Colwellbacteria bacterium]
MGKEGEREKFLEAYDAWADAIFRHCYFRVSDKELAKDLVQETYSRAWAYLADGGVVENFRAFLYRIANNLIIDNSRKKKALSLDALMDEGFAPAANPTNSEAAIMGHDALRLVRSLDEKYREVIIMRYIDDLTPKEIAAVLEEKENVISVRLHRGLKKVKVLLEAEAQKSEKRK